MPEVIRIGGLELRFLQSKDDTGGSLDVFEMLVPPDSRMPVPHYHETWDETIYGVAGVTTWSVDGKDFDVGPGQTVFIKRGIVHGFRNDTQDARHVPVRLEPWRPRSRVFPRDGCADCRWSPRPREDEGDDAALWADSGPGRVSFSCIAPWSQLSGWGRSARSQKPKGPGDPAHRGPLDHAGEDRVTG